MGAAIALNLESLRISRGNYLERGALGVWLWVFDMATGVSIR